MSVLASSFYRQATGIVLSYSIDNRKSFERVKYWMEQVERHGKVGVSKILVATKCDLEERAVSRSEGNDLAKQYGMKFFETSAKADLNVTDVFMQLTKEMKAKNFLKDKKKVKGSEERFRLKTQDQPREVKEDKCC